MSPNALRSRLVGCITPVATPFDAEGRFSRAGFEAVLDFLAGERSNWAAGASSSPPW